MTQPAYTALILSGRNLNGHHNITDLHRQADLEITIAGRHRIYPDGFATNDRAE